MFRFNVPAMLSRRSFLCNATVAATALASGCATFAGSAPVIDTHTHFYDPRRPQGVPWPPKDDAILYRPTLPADYRKVAEPLGIAGTLVVEASPWEEDNQWVLDLAANDRFLVGTVGHLKPGRPGFRAHLERFARNPLFRGIRIGGWDGGFNPNDPAVLADLKLVADRDLTVDLLVGPDQMPDAVKLGAALPSLRIVIDHCANVRMTPPPHPPKWVDGIVACHYQENIFMKVSGLVEGTGKSDGSAPRALETYLPVLDTLWNSFGENRLIFGSNWPVSERFAPLTTVHGIVAEYFGSKGASARNKYFRGNAARAYKLKLS